MNVDILGIPLFVVFFQLILFSGFLFLIRKKHVSNLFLSVHLFSQSLGIFQLISFAQRSFFIQNYPILCLIGYPFIFLWGPTFFLFVKFAAYKNAKWTTKQLFHFIPFILIFFFLLTTFYLAGSNRQSLILSTKDYYFFRYHQWLDIFVRVQVLFYIIKSLILLTGFKNEIKKNYSSVNQTNLRWIKFMVWGFTISYLFSVPFIVYSYFHPGVYSKLIYLFVILPYYCYFNIIFLKAWIQPEIFSGICEPEKYRYSKLRQTEAKKIISLLNTYVIKEKPHLNCDLTLKELAKEINSTPRILSQIINEHFEVNFYDYINKLRIEESKKILSDFSHNKTILEILYESGFNSKSVFNASFKKNTGMTPTQFRRNQLDKV